MHVGVIVQDVPVLVEKLKGERLQMPAMVSLFTGHAIGRGAGAPLESS